MKSDQKRSFWALMVTQFFGAFNDNVMKVLVSLLIVEWVARPAFRNQLVDLSGAVFVAPFLIFSMVAGRISDRVGKPRVVVATKVWELLVVTVAVLSLMARSIHLMMIALFLLSTQAAFFSPAKYGVLPELMGEDEISEANGLLNGGTFLAILLGTIVGSFFADDLPIASLIMGGASLLGLFFSFFMKPLPAAKPGESLAWNPLKDLQANWKIIKRDPVLRNGVIAVNYFWLMGAVMQLNVFLYAKEMMDDTQFQWNVLKEVEKFVGHMHLVSAILLIAVTLGIGIGSLLAGELSNHKVELAFVPVGALGMSLFAIDLLFSYHSSIRTRLDFFMLGMSAGFYEIPLASLVQWRSPAAERGRILATVNFFSFVAILGASVVLYILGSLLQLNPAQVFFALGFASLMGLAMIAGLSGDGRAYFASAILRKFGRHASS